MQPETQPVENLRKTKAFKQGKKAAANRFKPTLYFTFSLGHVGLGMVQADGK